MTRRDSQTKPSSSTRRVDYGSTRVLGSSNRGKRSPQDTATAARDAWELDERVPSHQGPSSGSGGSGSGEHRSSATRRAMAAIVVAFAFAVAVSCLSLREMGERQELESTSRADLYRGVVHEQLDAIAVTGDGGGSPRIARGRSSGTGFSLVATNEYGEYDRGARALYGFDMLVEPHKETTISVTYDPASQGTSSPQSPGGSISYSWLLVREDDESDVVPLVDADGGRGDSGPESGPSSSAVKVKLTEPGVMYSLRVRQLGRQAAVAAEDAVGDSGVPSPSSVYVLAEETVTVHCKHVRRELRDLTEADSTAFFSAMREFYTVELEDGKEKYGKAFANSKLMAAYHNSHNYCFHSGMHFLNAHASFDLWAERSLQMIDPSVALHYWDFTIDAATLGPNWGDSEIFGIDMFGSALGSPDNGYQISEGWFAGARSIYDPNETFVADLAPGHSLYGYIDARFNFQSVDGVTRTNSYCGLKGQIEFATCNVIIGCFEGNDNIYDWNVCMEDQVHAANHGMIGGAFNCNTDMAQFQADHPNFGSGLLSFVLEYVLVNKWPGNSLTSAYNTCDQSCTPGQEEPCGCTCETDFDDWSDDEVYNMMASTMGTLASRSHGAKYIYGDPTSGYGFMQDGVPVGDESDLLLMRTLLTLACEPGALGAMSVGPSILDPVFWALHPVFEKATQILQLSPTYKDTYNFTWVGTDCGDGTSGGYIDDTMPFTEREFGFGDSSAFLTNQEIIDLLSPSNPRLPYVYDKFDTWGACTEWGFETS